MIIRKAQEKDLEAINRIYNQAVELKATADTEPVSAASRMDWFGKHDPALYPVFVSEAESRVTGWLSFSAYRPGRSALRYTAEISYYIDSSFHQTGIGTALVRFAIENAPAYAFRNLFAIILETNTGSIRLMEKCGFEKWGFLPRIADFGGKVCGQVYYGLNLTTGA